MQLLDAAQVKRLIQTVGLPTVLTQMIERLRYDFSRWDVFDKSPRHAVYHPQGVLELMPCADDEMYTFKYVNGHPKNTEAGRLCVAAFGMLADQRNGYPLLMCDMTWLTAIRTACMVALVAEVASPAHHQGRLGLIGTGAQAEFIVAAMQRVWPLSCCAYFDIDASAMEKFSKNINQMEVDLHPCDSAQAVCEASDVVVTLTAAKQRNRLIDPAWLHPGQLICALGGDCPGKTELDVDLVQQCCVLVEYAPQTRLEGELQQCPDHDQVIELHQAFSDQSLIRPSEDTWVLFDSVGFAVEDFSALRVIEALLKAHPECATVLEWVPNVMDPKDLYGALVQDTLDV